MKRLILFTVIVLFGITLFAQETFFPTKEGTVLIYQSFDKKGKATKGVRYTIEKVNIRGNDLDIKYLCEALGAKDDLVYKEEITIYQKENVISFDMSGFLNKAAFQQNGQIPAEIKITGNSMQIPVNAEPGMTMPDANVAMSMKMGFINMKMSADVTNRKVEAVEDITVKAGTFKCYKFTSDVSVTAMGINVKTKNTDWYAKGIGTVKTEAYDKNGKLQSVTELVDINN